MRAPLRLVAPWPALLAAIATFVLMMVLVAQFQAWNDPTLMRLGAIVVLIAAAGLGAFRAWVFHPAYRRDYRRWLASTPWTVDRPLPFGPIELDWSDGVPLAVLIGSFGLLSGRDSIRVLSVFLIAHVLVLIPTFWRAANHVPAYAALFGLGTMLQLWRWPWACATTGVVVYLIAYDGLRIALKDLDRIWPSWVSTFIPAAAPRFDPDATPCGWPHDRLLREPEAFPAGWRVVEDGGRSDDGRASAPTWADHLAWSLLAGWWASCPGGVLSTAAHANFLLLVVPSFVTACSLGRLILYQPFYQSPLGPWGRLWTGRWVIPGYDVHLLAPALIPAAAVAAFTTSTAAGVPWQVAGPAVPALALFLALRTPPGLRRWRLVGRHRIVTTRAERAKGR